MNTVTAANPGRQGDVALVRVDSLPKGLEPTKRDHIGRIVLAYGEASGHSHAIRDSHVTGFRMAGSEEVDYIEVGGSGAATLNHEYESGKQAEHHALDLPPGAYKVVRQQEYSPEAIRRVVD